MSYAPEDLRIGGIELFADATQFSDYGSDYSELPARRGMSDLERFNRREKRKRARAADRERRAAERAKQSAKFVFRPEGVEVPWPHYICERCRSTAPTHRCPG